MILAFGSHCTPDATFNAANSLLSFSASCLPLVSPQSAAYCWSRISLAPNGRANVPAFARWASALTRLTV